MWSDVAYVTAAACICVCVAMMGGMPQQSSPLSVPLPVLLRTKSNSFIPVNSGQGQGQGGVNEGVVLIDRSLPSPPRPTSSHSSGGATECRSPLQRSTDSGVPKYGHPNALTDFVTLVCSDNDGQQVSFCSSKSCLLWFLSQIFQ